MSNWKAMFYELLDSVEQIPDPMAEEVWSYYNKLAEEKE
jgi:hypothetical protein